MSMILHLVTMVSKATKDLSKEEKCKFMLDENFKKICGNSGTYNLFLEEYRKVYPDMKPIMDKYKLSKNYTPIFDYSRKE